MNFSLIAAVLITALLVPWVFAVLALLIASRLRQDHGKRRQDFVTAIGLTVLMGASTRLNLQMAQHFPRTIDARLWRWDETLHIDPLALIYFMQAHPGLSNFMQVIYYSLPIVVAAAWIKEQNFELRRAVAIAAVSGWIFAAAFPAVGPHWYLDGYTAAMRHCVPALEWTWALLLGINARTWFRVPLWNYAGLLAVASILLGEHYLIDLILAVPYTFAVQWLAVNWPDLVTKFRRTASATAAA